MVGPQRVLVGVEQVEDGVGQLQTDGRAADDHQHDSQLALSRLERRRRRRVARLHSIAQRATARLPFTAPLHRTAGYCSPRERQATRETVHPGDI